MTSTEMELEGVVLFEPDVYRDDRGYFLELWNQQRSPYADLEGTSFVQDNLSHSRGGVLRGLHFQNPSAQGKLVTVLEGEVWDVVVDIRGGSPTFGEWVGVTLSAENHRQLYVPEGFAHGFVVTGASALFHYKCTAPYNPDAEHSIHWKDPRLAIEWPVSSPVVSDKDAAAPSMADLPETVFQF